MKGSELKENPWERDVIGHSVKQKPDRAVVALQQEVIELRKQLDESRRQQDQLRQKAKELSDVMRRMFQHHVDQQKLLLEKDLEVTQLRERIVSLEALVASSIPPMGVPEEAVAVTSSPGEHSVRSTSGDSEAELVQLKRLLRRIGVLALSENPSPMRGAPFRSPARLGSHSARDDDGMHSSTPSLYSTPVHRYTRPIDLHSSPLVTRSGSEPNQAEATDGADTESSFLLPRALTYDD